MGRITTSCRYVTDIIEKDLLSLRELGGGVNSKTLQKLRYF